MEDQNLKLDNNQCDDDKTDEDVKEEASSNNENKKEKEETSDSSKSSDKEEVSQMNIPNTTESSDEPNCSICLGPIKNKSYSSTCLHVFCFNCLRQWSELKNECPLCKQSFKSIIHNVQSSTKYDEFYIKNSINTENLWALVRSRQQQYLDRIRSHRMTYAPHSVNSTETQASQQSVRDVPCSIRRRVYEENLWVRCQPSSRMCCSSPRFYRKYIRCTDRFLPWLNRELPIIMSNNAGQINYAIELILMLTTCFPILSQEYFRNIEPFTAEHTAHFIHEFYNFAISPYESIESYDEQYGMSAYEPFEEISFDSDVIPVYLNETILHKSASNETKRKKETHSNKNHVTVLENSSCSSSHESSKRICVQKSGNCSSSDVVSKNTYVSNSNPFEVPEPSTSTFTEFSTGASSLDLVESNNVECLANQDDDECQVVEVLKPRLERTLEIVNLSSDDET